GSVHSATAQAMRAGVRIMTVASGRQRTIPTFGFATKRKPRHVASLEAQLDRRPLSSEGELKLRVRRIDRHGSRQQRFPLRLIAPAQAWQLDEHHSLAG